MKIRHFYCKCLTLYIANVIKILLSFLHFFFSFLYKIENTASKFSVSNIPSEMQMGKWVSIVQHKQVHLSLSIKQQVGLAILLTLVVR